MAPRAEIATAPVAPGSADALIVDEARRALAAKLRAGGIESPDLDARLLVGHALDLDQAALAGTVRRIDAAEQNVIAGLATLRLAGEPVARILGRKEFWSLPLRIDAATLVPRPETETVVEAALAAVDAHGPRSRALRIADLGTGSGALVLALLSELRRAFGIGIDVSFGALVVARDNARRFDLQRAAFVAGNMADALRGPFDLIVSNPPYIRSGDIAALATEVRDFDPRAALDGGTDGLDFYRAMATTAPALLASDGALIVELGIGQVEPVTALFAAAGLAPSLPRPDFNGVPRALVARKRA
jgi:release factor glutamine methyltransferase